MSAAHTKPGKYRLCNTVHACTHAYTKWPCQKSTHQQRTYVYAHKHSLWLLHSRSKRQQWWQAGCPTIMDDGSKQMVHETAIRPRASEAAAAAADLPLQVAKAPGPCSKQPPACIPSSHLHIHTHTPAHTHYIYICLITIMPPRHPSCCTHKRTHSHRPHTPVPHPSTCQGCQQTRATPVSRGRQSHVLPSAFCALLQICTHISCSIQIHMRRLVASQDP